MVKAHVGGKLYGHLACVQVSEYISSRTQLHVPNGPMISTVFGGSVVAIFCLRFAGGSRNLRSTPCGSDNGALPIRDRVLEVQEKSLESYWGHKAGTRKSGSSVETFLELARRQLDLSIIVELLQYVMLN